MPTDRGSQADRAKIRTAFSFWRETFHPYQLDVFNEPSDFAIWNKARQIGLSHAIAGDAVKRSLFDASTNIILSASQELAAEVLQKARQHARFLYMAGVPWARTVVDNSTRIAFASGGRVIALPSSPRTARSFTGNVYFDEFAYHDDPKKVWDAAAAMATRGRRSIRVISTPNGAQGLFYKWVQKAPPGWSPHRITVDDAIRQGMVVDLKRLWQLAGGDERIFAQWYKCSFLDAAMQYIPTAMADRALNWLGAVPDLAFAELHAGLDVGRQNDLTVLSIVAVVLDTAYVLPFFTCKRTKYKAQLQMIRQAREMLPWQSLHVDATGLGNEMAEELVDEFGEDEVKPVWFTNQAKEDLATRALRWFRDDRMRFPRGKDGDDLHAEAISVRRVVSTSGNILYEVPTTEDGHGDRWWSTCLALKGAGEPQSPLEMGQEPLLAVA